MGSKELVQWLAKRWLKEQYKELALIDKKLSAINKSKAPNIIVQKSKLDDKSLKISNQIQRYDNLVKRSGELDKRTADLSRTIKNFTVSLVNLIKAIINPLIPKPNNKQIDNVPPKPKATNKSYQASNSILKRLQKIINKQEAPLTVRNSSQIGKAMINSDGSNLKQYSKIEPEAKNRPETKPNSASHLLNKIRTAMRLGRP